MADKPVIVGVDGSEESLLAAEWAALEAQRRSTRLRIVSAPLPAPLVHAYHASPATVTGALRAVSARALNAAVLRSEAVAPGLPVEACLLSGPPPLAMAGSGWDASLLVVGARGAGGFAAMVLGSVSRYAAMHAPCPVVVVRQGTVAVHREIAVGVRDSQEASGALAFAFDEAAMRGADLIVVHAWYGFPSALRLSVDGEDVELPSADPEQITAGAASGLAAALKGWRDKYPGVPVRHDVIHGHPARVLAGYSARADLVVLGRHDGGRAGGAGIGTIQHAVLDHARGPVAVVPSAVAATWAEW
jgi:nucleotide-binding universal stress UspA family protein